MIILSGKKENPIGRGVYAEDPTWVRLSGWEAFAAQENALVQDLSVGSCLFPCEALGDGSFFFFFNGLREVLELGFCRAV